MIDSDGTLIAAPAVYQQFPAKVVGPDGREWTEVRAILTPDRLYIYGEGPLGQWGARTVVTTAVVNVVEMRPVNTGWVATDHNGQEWAISRYPGCGCGSPIRHMPSPTPVYLNVNPSDVEQF